jgi:hypothetical protein
MYVDGKLQTAQISATTKVYTHLLCRIGITAFFLMKISLLARYTNEDPMIAVTTPRHANANSSLENVTVSKLVMGNRPVISKLARNLNMITHQIAQKYPRQRLFTA